MNNSEKIVIMGASSGIGLALARALAGAGYRLGLAARRTAPLEELAREYPGYVEYAAIDITSNGAPASPAGPHRAHGRDGPLHPHRGSGIHQPRAGT